VVVTFDRGFVVDSTFGFGEQFIDAAQPAAGPVVTVLVVDDPIRGAAGLLRAGRCPPLLSTSPSETVWLGCLSRHSRTTSGRSGMRVPRMNDNRLFVIQSALMAWRSAPLCSSKRSR